MSPRMPPQIETGITDEGADRAGENEVDMQIQVPTKNPGLALLDAEARV